VLRGSLAALSSPVLWELSLEALLALQPGPLLWPPEKSSFANSRSLTPGRVPLVNATAFYRFALRLSPTLSLSDAFSPTGCLCFLRRSA